MGDSRGSKAGSALIPNRVHPAGSAAAVLDFAVAQILRDDTALGVLPAVLERLVAVFGLRAAVAFRPSARPPRSRRPASALAGQPATVLAAHPGDAAGPALLAALSVPQREAARGVPVQLAGEGAAPASAMVTYSMPADGQCLCALALIGDAGSWDEEIRSTAHAVAALVAAQIRHANDLAKLAERQALTRALITGALEAELTARQLAEQAQRQLTEQNERLRRIDEARNQFLAIVSHELRTPLTSIVSFIELIRGEAGGLTPEGLSFLDIIERNADRLHRLIGDLLMLDRLEAGALPLDLAAVSVADLVTEAVRAATPGAVKQGVTLTVSVLSGPPVQADARRLMQVLDNLIANAVKFSHRNGLVRVTAGCDRSTWRIDVADSGIGIPAEEAGELFSRFVRGSNARTAGLPGSGLGLSIVKVLAEMHGGHVEVRSTLGLGSTFSVFLPVAGP